MVRNSLHCPATMFDRYSTGIVDIIFSNATAKDAIAKCEKSLAEELYALLGEEIDGDESMDAMLARLAARFGIDERDLHGDTDSSDVNEDETGVKTDLFKSKGGAV